MHPRISLDPLLVKQVANNFLSINLSLIKETAMRSTFKIHKKSLKMIGTHCWSTILERIHFCLSRYSRAQLSQLKLSLLFNFWTVLFYIKCIIIGMEPFITIHYYQYRLMLIFFWLSDVIDWSLRWIVFKKIIDSCCLINAAGPIFVNFNRYSIIIHSLCMIYLAWNSVFGVWFSHYHFQRK